MKKKSKITLRNSETSSLSEVLDKFLGAFNLEKKFYETQLIQNWKNIVGTTIASRTEYVVLKGNELVIKINSAPLRNELHMSKNSLKDHINKKLGKEIVHSIVIL